MSLLNDLLNDLNENKSRIKAQPLYIPPEKKTIRSHIFAWLPRVLGLLSIILLIPLLHRIIWPEEYAKSQSSSSVAQIKNDYSSTLTVFPVFEEKGATSSKEDSLKSSLPPPPEKYTSALQSIQQAFAKEPIDKIDSSTTHQLSFSLNKTAGADKAHEQQKEESEQFTKVFNELTDRQWCDMQYNKALEALEVGNEQESIELLEGIIQRTPHFIRSRETLSAIYLSRGEGLKAEGIIDGGLKYRPRSLPLNMIKARILLQDDKAQAALKLLRQFHPSSRSYPDFYGLLAAIFQQLGQIKESGSIYKELVEVEPSNGQYWLGYAIALEAQDQYRQAASAYQRASHSFDIDPEIRVYAESRLKKLQG